METLFGAVLVLAFPIISIAALIMTLNARVRVRVLELRIADLEVRRPAPPIAAAPAAAALAAAPVDEPPPPVVEQVPAVTLEKRASSAVTTAGFSRWRCSVTDGSSAAARTGGC